MPQMLKNKKKNKKQLNLIKLNLHQPIIKRKKIHKMVDAVDIIFKLIILI